MGNCSKNCDSCRFFNGKCVKFSVNVTEDCKACNDYAESVKLTESTPVRMQLND